MTVRDLMPVENELMVGDCVRVCGLTYEIAEIWAQDNYKGAWDVEFIDSRNCYHHWKSDLDGGTVIYKGV